jgi:hypothetical protein
MDAGQTAVRILGGLMLVLACSGEGVDFESNGQGGKIAAGGSSGAAGKSERSGGAGALSSGGYGGEPDSSGGKAASGGTGAGGAGTSKGGFGAGGASSGGQAGAANGGWGGELPEDGCIVVGNQFGPHRVSYEDAVLTWRTLQDTGHLVMRRFDADGNVLVQATTGSPVQPNPYRFDREYDEHGNQIENMMTYTSDFDLSKKPEPPHQYAHDYAHTYDPEALLLRTETDGALPRWEYAHDDAGRCVGITRVSAADDSRVETRSFEGDQWIGWRRVDSRFGRDIEIEGALHFDARGRLTLWEQDGSSSWMLDPADGEPDVIETHDYAADGSVTVTSLDFTGDLVNAMALHKGVLQGVWKSVWTFTPDCAEIMAQLPQRTALSCAYPDRPVQSFLDLTF